MTVLRLTYFTFETFLINLYLLYEICHAFHRFGTKGTLEGGELESSFYIIIKIADGFIGLHDSFIYVCSLKAMPQPIIRAIRTGQLDWQKNTNDVIAWGFLASINKQVPAF